MIRDVVRTEFRGRRYLDCLDTLTARIEQIGRDLYGRRWDDTDYAYVVWAVVRMRHIVGRRRLAEVLREEAGNGRSQRRSDQRVVGADPRRAA